MSFPRRRAKMERDHPIKDPHRLWAAWLLGAVSHCHPGRIMGPVHPALRREFDAGSSHARQGYVRIGDLAEGLAMVRHVEAGNPPWTFTGEQKGLAL